MRNVTLKNLVKEKETGSGIPVNQGNSGGSLYRASSPLPPGESCTKCYWVVPTSGVNEFYITSTPSADLKPDHIYYVSFKVYYPGNVNGSFDFYWPIAEPPGASGLKATQSKTWTRISARFDRKQFQTGSQKCRWDYNHNGVNSGVNLSAFILVDLTEAFGDGLEPSKEWCDEHIAWFGSTTTVSVYENLKELFDDTADAIRSKSGGSAKILACDFPSRIRSL